MTPITDAALYLVTTPPAGYIFAAVVWMVAVMVGEVAGR